MSTVGWIVTALAFVGGLASPIAVLATFNKVAVRLSLPVIIDCLLENAAFLDRVAAKLSKHPDMDAAMKGVAEHKAVSLRSGLEGALGMAEERWSAQFNALKADMDRREREERQWRRDLMEDIREISRNVRRLDRTTAFNEGRHNSTHEDESEVDRA